MLKLQFALYGYNSVNLAESHHVRDKKLLISILKFKKSM